MKFEEIYENVLNGVGLASVGADVPLSHDEEDVPDQYDNAGPDDEIVIAPELSEKDAADEIITHAKKLRKKVGSDSYYRIRKIIKLAEKVKGVDPVDTTIVASV